MHAHAHEHDRSLAGSLTRTAHRPRPHYPPPPTSSQESDLSDLPVAPTKEAAQPEQELGLPAMRT